MKKQAANTGQRDATRNITARGLSLRANSYNTEDRSFRAVVATETPAQVWDMRNWEQIDEILVAEGGEFPERCPLLDSHNRSQSKDVIGSALDFHREGRDWIGRGVFAADDPEVDRIAHRVRDGHITDVSIGYEVLSYIDIPARTTQKVNGRPYTAGERTLRVTTRWRVRELSVTPIGADSQAKIRDHSGREAPNIRSVVMNPRLLQYLRSLGLSATASEEEVRQYMSCLRGVERTIANILDYPEIDNGARSSADLAIRHLGFDPTNPVSPLTRRGRRNDDEEEREDEETDEEREMEDDEEEREDSEEDEEREDDEENEERGRRKRRKRRRGNLSVREIERRAVRHEQQRQNRLREMAGELVPAEILNRAIGEGWSVSRASAAFLQAIRDGRGEPLSGGAPAGHVRSNDYDNDSLVAALLLRSGVNDPSANRVSFDSRTGGFQFRSAARDDSWQRAVDRGNDLRDISHVELFARTFNRFGIRVESTASNVLGELHQQRAATAASINALKNIYTQTFGALMLVSFESAPDTTSQWTIERTNPNFLQNERVRIKKGGVLTKHAKGGEAEHFSLEDTVEYTRVFRYSAQSVFDEMDIINDTMFNALPAASPQELGEAAASLRPDIAYSLLLEGPNLSDGSPLFSESARNLFYGSQWGKESLEKALAAIATQQENGRNLNLRGQFVIHPTSMQFSVADMIQPGTVVVSGNSDRIIPTNASVSKLGLQSVFDSRLDNGVTNPETNTHYAGNTEDWYVAAPPSRHTIEITYLTSSGRVPQVRSKILEQGQWGIGFDVKHDIGGKALARQGLVKMVADPEST